MVKFFLENSRSWKRSQGQTTKNLFFFLGDRFGILGEFSFEYDFPTHIGLVDFELGFMPCQITQFLLYYDLTI